VYDFKNPFHGHKGFAWSNCDPNWQAHSPEQFRSMLDHPIAVAGFKSDWDAMVWADAGVLVMPCGRSAHIEAGYFVGAGKPLIILLAEGEPELMYKMATKLCLSLDEVVEALRDLMRLSKPYVS
jgi:nucleoside 2-deoxyribosyltransferase